jgi:peptide/nickel transport system permease protein
VSAAVPVPVVAAPVDSAVPASVDEERWQRAAFRVGIGWLVVVVLGSVVVRLLASGQATALNLASTLQGPSLSHPFGTDVVGRDLLVRTLYAAWTDLGVGAIGTLLPLALGVLIGVVAGYAGGVADTALMRVTDFVLAFPFIVLVVAIVVITGPGVTGVVIGLVVKGFPAYARLARGEMLVLREKQFILAARTLGLSRRRVVFRHALPHVVRPCLVFFLSDLVGNVLLLASLSFLGLGVQPPTPEWGAIIADGKSYLLSAWWISALPGLFVVLVGIALNLVGEGLAERLRSRTGSAR